MFSLSLSPVVTIGLDSMIYSVTEGESVTAVVSVMSDDVTLDRDVVVTVMTSDGTADSGIVYMPIHVQYMYGSGVLCMAMECIHVQCSYSAVYIACKYSIQLCTCVIQCTTLCPYLYS